MAIPMANGQVIGAFDKVSDVNVIMTIVHPQPVIGLGNMVILNKVTERASLEGANPEPIISGFTLDPAAVTGKAGDVVTVQVKDIAPKGANSDLDVTSSDPKIATVAYNSTKKGYDVTLQKDGAVLLTWTAESGGMQKQQAVTVGDTAKALTPAADVPGKEIEPSKDRTFSNELNNTDRMNGLLARKVDTTTGALYREYRNLAAVENDYGRDTLVYKKATAYFAQDYHSDRVAVIDYVDGQLMPTLKSFWSFNWTFAIFSDNSINDETVLASNIFEANADHFLVLQSDDLSDFNNCYGQNYTIALKHDVKEAMDAAFVGAIATRPVGSTTWKFKMLKGITPEQVTTQERSGIDSVKAIAYIYSDGREETSEGWTLSGEYIDLLHGVIWVNQRVTKNLVDLLHNNDKLSYDHNGISMINSAISDALLDAYNRKIIAEIGETGRGDYSVTTTPVEQQSKQDLSDRHYGGASFTYHASNAIHTITVHGVVRSDTILS